jgi:hypothetical protein
VEPHTSIAPEVCRRLTAVFSDLDDTLTSGGKLPARAYDALWRLRDAGIAVVVVTGRPAGWADLIMRLWPVAGVVGENGACIYRLDEDGRAVRWYAQDENTRRANRRALLSIGRRVAAELPGLRLAADQPFRETDLAIDICEEADGLDERTTATLQRLLEEHGLTYKISSIHINAWFGRHDKASTCRRFIREVLGDDPGGDRQLFVGDSPNDEPLFASFGLGVGVRNIDRFASVMQSPPRYVTTSRGADGFVELTDHVLACRADGTGGEPG